MGAVYGFLVGGLTFPYGIGLTFSGPIFGTASGLCVGPLEGLVLWGVTMLHHRGGQPRDSERYWLAVGLACSAVCIVALALIFELTARKSGTSFVSGPAYDRDELGPVALVVASAAQAAVSISRAELSGTQLRIEGQVSANRTITVDGVAMGTSDGSGVRLELGGLLGAGVATALVGRSSTAGQVSQATSPPHYSSRQPRRIGSRITHVHKTKRSLLRLAAHVFTFTS